MTQFWFGFLLGFVSAIAFSAVSVIAGAIEMYQRQERQRQQSVDAIMAKVLGDYPSTQVRDPGTPHMAPYSKRPH